MITKTIKIASVLAVGLTLSASADDTSRTYELWEPEAAPNNGRSNWEATKDSKRPKSYDRDWERWSYPIGNGYTGVSIFGRTDTERVQITDKTLHIRGKYRMSGSTLLLRLAKNTPSQSSKLNPYYKESFIYTHQIIYLPTHHTRPWNTPARGFAADSARLVSSKIWNK